MFRIHVVNSVKGGCGKSTFSLFMADYLSRNKINNVIIDLDICGSSWYLSNKSFLEKKEKCSFLTDLILDYKGNIIRDHVFKVRTGEDADHLEPTIHVVMSDPQKAGIINEEEVDLFESTVLQLIKSFQGITDYEYLKEKDISKVEEPVADIILDMPPGYETHSERILKHLLIDLNSELYLDYFKKKDSRSIYNNKSQKGYEIYLYMLSGVDRAKLEPNIYYINNLYKGLTYSTDITVFNPKRIFYIINNVDNPQIDNKSSEKNSVSELIKNNAKSIISKKAKYDYKIPSVYYIPHIDFTFAMNKFNASVKPDYTPDDFLVIEKNEKEIFKLIFDEIFM